MDRFFEIEDLIKIEVLQNIQDSFAKATGMGAVTVDYKGDPITQKSNFTEFCEAIRCKDEFFKKCNKCDAYGGVQAAITGKPYVYKCHAGLVDFAVPIIVKGTYSGAILGGQVILEESDLNFEKNRHLYKWINDNELLNKFYNLKIKKYEEVQAAANLMHQITNYFIEQTFINDAQGINYNHIKEIQKEMTITNEKEIYSKEIEKAIDYINKNIKKSITLQDVANHINLSTNYLSKLFKKEINVNFITYLTNRRIELAKDMLKNPNIPIINIAIDLSYNQANYFSKVFKKSVGITPTEYRENYTV